MTKAELRDRMRTKLRSMSAEDRRTASAVVARGLAGLEVFRRAKTISFYLPLPEEVDTWPAIAEAMSLGKRVAAPRCEPGPALRHFAIHGHQGLRANSYGILEPLPGLHKPVPTIEIDLAVVPGVAFDRKGNRLGRGLGYYDRYLAELRKGVWKVGLAFSVQVLDEVPVEAFDVRLDAVLTETSSRLSEIRS